MKSEMKDSLFQLMVRIIFVVVPTAVIGYITLVYLNVSYTAFETSLIGQSLFFTAGLTLAYSLYFFRARWLVTFIILWGVYTLTDKVIQKLPGEFDVFYTHALFQLYAALFIIGWIFGFLLIRLRYSYLILFGLLAVITFASVSNTIDISLSYILLHLVPVIAYGLYMLLITPLHMHLKGMDLRKTNKMLIRFVAFILLVVFAFIFAEKLFKKDLVAVEKELQARGAKEKKPESGDSSYDDRYGLMDKKGKNNDEYKLKDTMKVNSKMSQSDRLMFCSKLDFFFPNGAPRPLYFVYHYLTKYDAANETFIHDLSMPFPDEFDVDPSALPIFHSRQNLDIIENSKAHIKRYVVDAEVYVASNTWKHALVAPASAFFIQSIPVDKDFQKTFPSAYKVKSYVSDLNDAYLVYNPTASPLLAPYQEKRFEELRNVNDYKGIDSSFYNYYTQMPPGPLYDSIRKIARAITTQAYVPVDKVIAVRDYFMKKDKNGRPVFRYTLQPGSPMDPNIPNMSMISNFLFKTHAGYCTYYAAASLFMLRSMGIPCRFTTGFATVNRSDKNKGWYWFYASQAHAWTQVYFPGYGWMDFDMTIGNQEQHEAPKPDGTPPLPPPSAWLVLNSKAETAADPKTKQLSVTFEKMIYFEKNYILARPITRSIDASLCRILYDKKDTTLSAIQTGDSLVIVSYQDDAKKIPKPRPTVSIDKQVLEFPNPIIADEIHIMPKKVAEQKKEKPVKKETAVSPSITLKEILLFFAKAVGGLLITLFLIPLLVLFYLWFRYWFASNRSKKADAIYKLTLYRFHMSGEERGDDTPLEYAVNKIDPLFHTQFETFMNVYLRLKYGPGTWLEEDEPLILQFSKSYGAAIIKTKGFFKVVLNYFNVLLAFRYFFRSPKNENQYQSTSL